MSSAESPVGEESRRVVMSDRAEPAERQRLGCLGLMGLWTTHAAMIYGTVLMPLALAVGVGRDEHAWAWARVLVPLCATPAAAAGAVFTIRRWRRPPSWAIVLAKSSNWEEALESLETVEQHVVAPNGSVGWCEPRSLTRCTSRGTNGTSRSEVVVDRGASPDDARSPSPT